MKNMKKALCILTLALLSLVLLTGCGSSDDKLSDPDAIEAYGTMIWGDELIDVCFTHDQEKICIYYDDGDYALFEPLIFRWKGSAMATMTGKSVPSKRMTLPVTATAICTYTSLIRI